MKTTVELNEQLLREAKKHAAIKGVTMRTVFEQALQTWVEEQRRPHAGYDMPDASVGGGAVRPEFAPWHWDKVADLAHEDDER